jgi:pimeloyl-ACP methyl ester carboxylesterase
MSVVPRRFDIGAGDVGPLSLVALEAGVGGQPLLLVHGFAAAKEDFAAQLEPLAAAGWHVVVPDLRGHGESDAPAGGYSLAGFADDVLALADALGWRRFALLGHSMGGVIVQHVALRAPDRLTALVLMDTTGAAAAVDAAIVELAAEVIAAGGMAALVEAQRAFGHPLETDAGRRLRETRPGWGEFGERKLLASSPAMYAAVSRELTSAPSRLAELAMLAVPTLVLVGDQDVAFLADSRRLAEVIPHARLALVPDAGHSPQHEAPEAWLAAVLAFLGDPTKSP